MSDKNGNRKAQFYLMFTLCFIYSGHFSFLSNNRSVGPVEGVSLPLTRVTEAEWPEERGLEAALPPSRFPNRELEEEGSQGDRKLRVHLVATSAWSVDSKTSGCVVGTEADRSVIELDTEIAGIFKTERERQIEFYLLICCCSCYSSLPSDGFSGSQPS